MSGHKERRSFELTATSTGSPEAVYALLADGSRWSEWASIVPSSKWDGAEPAEPGAVGAVRKLGFFPVAIREQITEAVPGKRHAYTLLSGVPAKDYEGVVTLEPTAEGGTSIVWSVKLRSKVPGGDAIAISTAKSMVGSVLKSLAAKAGEPVAAG